MRITYSPVRSDAPLTLFKRGEVLVVNGAAIDLAPLPEGAVLPRAAIACEALAGDVTRRGGRVELPILLPHGADAPHAALFPLPVLAEDGPVPVPGQALAEAPDGPPVQIDWGQMLTAAEVTAEARAAWRAAQVVPKLDLVLALAHVGVIAPTSAVAAANGAIPPEFEGIVAAMPAAQQLETRIRWAGAVEIPRTSAFILAVQAAVGMSDATLDTLFGWADA